jgi:feruloyl esterase
MKRQSMLGHATVRRALSAASIPCLCLYSLSGLAQSSRLLATTCDDLGNLALERGRVASAELMPEGPFTEQTFGRGGGQPQPIPEHCRVRMVLTPTADSNINVELWLPTENWNGKFMAVGNGGWAGSIQGYGAMQDALRRGYATAGTDTGHSAADGPAGTWALGHPEKIIDFAYRAMHDMTVKSKRVIAEFYEPALEYSYYSGCSTGGRQGVMAAQRYPGDFDGIIAGALANRHLQMHTSGVLLGILPTLNPDERITPEVADTINSAVMAQCDTLGEGFLNNPRQCSVDFSSLDLTPGQLKSVERFYNGIRTSDGWLLFSGQAMGNPIPPMQGLNGEPNAMAFDSIRILGFQDPDYDWRDFDLDRDLPTMVANAGFVDATDPDLRAFKAHGGKLLLYAGWGDTGISPENTIYYYESVVEELGAGQQDWMRLFLAPGMGHCGGGPGVNTFETINALEQWREHGLAPDELMGSNPRTGLERPLCPYPEYAEYDGSGDLNDAGNWSCRAP